MNIVAQLTPKVRVVTDSIQWRLQEFTGKRWADRSFCQTKQALLRSLIEYAWPIPVAALLPLDALPDHIKDKVPG
jgi:hypothetical protein